MVTVEAPHPSDGVMTFTLMRSARCEEKPYGVVTVVCVYAEHPAADALFAGEAAARPPTRIAKAAKTAKMERRLFR